MDSKMKIAVQRCRNEISINGNEYLLGDDFNILLFNTEENAIKYLVDKLNITQSEVFELIMRESIILTEYTQSINEMVNRDSE